MNFEEKINELFQNTYTELNKNHNEAINAFENYCNINNCEIPILVNYDTHSDVYLNLKQYRSTIANWVNFCFSKLGVIEYYWIIPNYIMQNQAYKKNFENKNNILKETFQSGAMRVFGELNEVIEEKFLINKQNSELITSKKLDIINKKNKKFFLPLIEQTIGNLAPVTIYIVPFDKISYLKGKDIALSIDADSFCNSGHDTVSSINNINITDNELHKEFELFIDMLYKNEIKICAASLTRSPAYFPFKFEKNLTEFFEKIKRASSYRLE